jgi:hypothetical protein
MVISLQNAQRIALASAFVLLFCACASTGASSGSTARDVITRAEIDEIGVDNAYDAVRRLHATWLRPRLIDPTTGEPPPVIVYMDGIRAGELDFLRTIRAEDIDRMLYYHPTDATTKWGTGHGGGAIEVITLR